jgi:hypothetical protein
VTVSESLEADVLSVLSMSLTRGNGNVDLILALSHLLCSDLIA